MSLADSVRLAVGTCTIIPAGPVRVDRRVAGPAMIMTPLAVLPVGVVAVALGWLLRMIDAPPLLAGVAVVAGLAVGTRALHLDGLADTVDGLGSGRAAPEALAIMRRGDVGPMGVVALGLVLAAQAVAMAELVGSWRGALLAVVAVCASRLAVVVLCEAGVPAARADGLGVAVAGSVSSQAVGLTSLVMVCGVVVAGQLLVGSGLVAALWLGVAALAVWGLRRRCVARLGGVTGDVLGAGVELWLTVLLVGWAL